jgi:hypothetical protein
VNAPVTKLTPPSNHATDARVTGATLKAMRPHQWVKNGFVLAPLVFAKGLGDVEMMVRSGAAFLCSSPAPST